MNIYLFDELSKVNEKILNNAINTLPEWRKAQNDKLASSKSKIQNAIAYHLLNHAIKQEKIKYRSNVDFMSGEIIYNEKGKPYFNISGIDFNISHCDSGIICAVSEDKDSIGVDIEQIRSYNNKIASRICCKEEQILLNDAISDTEKAEIFCEMWVLKEAYSKMTGNGFSEGFHKINTLLREKNNAFFYSCKKYGESLVPYYIGASCKQPKVFQDSGLNVCRVDLRNFQTIT